ncbi:MAG TPA: pyridoxal 5'-phosphate synthase glutaminase subunit PdxT [Fimbriimonadaceae bacterium]|nr:pyridoxal 5'-phosphate synthase glutaminase subunit PdxT [Fimbriimonadaceae bacterium]
MAERVGVLAIQGDFEKHLELLHRMATPAIEVRTPEDLQQVSRLIIPGGESTTVGLLLERYGLGEAIRSRAAEGMPVWGTCMGMILMAREVEGRRQYTLDLLDVTVRRNAFGAQVHSFEDQVAIEGLEEPVTGVFIRAPVVTRRGPEVELLATYGSDIVGVRQGRLVGTSFHPELTDDDRMHRWFLTL